MPADAAKQVGAVSFSGQAQSGADDLTYDVVLALAGVGGKGTLKGNVTGLSGTPQIDTALNLAADKPAPLLRLAGLAGPKAQSVGKLGIVGTLKGSAENMDLDLNLDGLGGKAKVAGNVQMPKEKPIAFNVALQADHPEFTQLLKMADMQSSGVSAGPLKASLKAQGSTEKASISDLNAAWGNSSISGIADYDATGAKPFVKANLKGGVVNLTPFMGGTAGGGQASGSGGGKGGSPWSEEPLDVSALRAQDADIDLTAQSLVMPDQQIDDLVAKVTLRNGVLDMQTLSGKIYGGSFDMSGSKLDASGTPKLDAKGKINQIQVGQVVGGGIAGNQVKGPLSMNLNATGSGESMADIMRSLNGSGDLDGSVMIIGKVEQQIGSALLGVLGQKVKQVQGITSAVNGILQSYTGVDNQLSGTFDIKQGVLNTQDFAFTNPKARGTAKGDFDIGGWAMNMLIDLFGADTQEAFMSIGLDGPMTPTPRFATNGAAGATGLMGLTQQGAFNPAGLVEGIPGIGKLPGIGSLLGGQQPAGGTTQPGVNVPGVGNVPGVNNVPGLGGLLGGKQQQPKQPDASQPGGVLPGVGDLQQQQQQLAPATDEPGSALPGAAPMEAAPQEIAPQEAPAEAAPAEQAPAEQAPAEQAPAEQAPAAEPGAAEPGAAPLEQAPQEAPAEQPAPEAQPQEQAPPPVEEQPAGEPGSALPGAPGSEEPQPQQPILQLPGLNTN
jgi:hypothetical protein